MRRWINAAFGMFVAILTLSCPHMAAATDIPIFPTGQVYKLNNLVWGQSGAQGFNNNYFFTPVVSAGSACIYVYNNNPTNAHPFVASALVTANQANSTPSDGTWQFIPGVALQGANFSASTTPSAPTFFAFPISGVSQIAISLSNSTVLGGVPDTVNVIIIQTQGTPCSPIVPPDPCQSVAFLKLGGSISTSGTTAVQIVAGTAGRVTYVCGYVLGFTGTSPTFSFSYGSGVNCATAPVTLSGAIPAITGSNIAVPGGSTQFSIPAGNNLCLTLGGTTPTAAGYIVVASQ